MYATSAGGRGAHAAQAGAMAAYQYQDVLRRIRVPADIDVRLLQDEGYNNTEGESGVVGVAARGSSSDTYSLYACRFSPDTKDTHTPLGDEVH